MKRVLIILSFLATLAIAPMTGAAYTPLCVSYDKNGNCSSSQCSQSDQAAGNCSIGPCASAPNSPACKDVAASSPQKDPIVTTIGTAAKIISIMVGFIAIIIIIISGIGMITSGGNSESVATARKRLTGAAVGLVIAALAWVLTSFVIKIVS